MEINKVGRDGDERGCSGQGSSDARDDIMERRDISTTKQRDSDNDSVFSGFDSDDDLIEKKSAIHKNIPTHKNSAVENPVCHSSDENKNAKETSAGKISDENIETRESSAGKTSCDKNVIILETSAGKISCDENVSRHETSAKISHDENIETPENLNCFSKVHIDKKESIESSILSNKETTRENSERNGAFCDVCPDSKIEERTEGKTDGITGGKTECITEVKTECITEEKTECITEGKTECITEEKTECITEVKTECITEEKTDDITEEKLCIPVTEERTLSQIQKVSLSDLPVNENSDKNSDVEEISDPDSPLERLSFIGFESDGEEKLPSNSSEEMPWIDFDSDDDVKDSDRKVVENSPEALPCIEFDSDNQIMTVSDGKFKVFADSDNKDGKSKVSDSDNKRDSPEKLPWIDFDSDNQVSDGEISDSDNKIGDRSRKLSDSDSDVSDNIIWISDSDDEITEYKTTKHSDFDNKIRDRTSKLSNSNNETEIREKTRSHSDSDNKIIGDETSDTDSDLTELISCLASDDEIVEDETTRLSDSDNKLVGDRTTKDSDSDSYVCNTIISVSDSDNKIANSNNEIEIREKTPSHSDSDNEMADDRTSELSDSDTELISCPTSDGKMVEHKTTRVSDTDNKIIGDTIKHSDCDSDTDNVLTNLIAASDSDVNSLSDSNDSTDSDNLVDILFGPDSPESFTGFQSSEIIKDCSNSDKNSEKIIENDTILHKNAEKRNENNSILHESSENLIKHESSGKTLENKLNSHKNSENISEDKSIHHESSEISVEGTVMHSSTQKTGKTEDETVAYESCEENTSTGSCSLETDEETEETVSRMRTPQKVEKIIESSDENASSSGKTEEILSQMQAQKMEKMTEGEKQSIETEGEKIETEGEKQKIETITKDEKQNIVTEGEKQNIEGEKCLSSEENIPSSLINLKCNEVNEDRQKENTLVQGSYCDMDMGTFSGFDINEEIEKMRAIRWEILRRKISRPKTIIRTRSKSNIERNTEKQKREERRYSDGSMALRRKGYASDLDKAETNGMKSPQKVQKKGMFDGMKSPVKKGLSLKSPIKKRVSLNSPEKKISLKSPMKKGLSLKSHEKKISLKSPEKKRSNVELMFKSTGMKTPEKKGFSTGNFGLKSDSVRSPKKIGLGNSKGKGVKSPTKESSPGINQLFKIKRVSSESSLENITQVSRNILCEEGVEISIDDNDVPCKNIRVVIDKCRELDRRGIVKESLVCKKKGQIESQNEDVEIIVEDGDFVAFKSKESDGKSGESVVCKNIDEENRSLGQEDIKIVDDMIVKEKQNEMQKDSVISKQESTVAVRIVKEEEQIDDENITEIISDTKTQKDGQDQKQNSIEEVKSAVEEKQKDEKDESVTKNISETKTQKDEEDQMEFVSSKQKSTEIIIGDEQKDEKASEGISETKTQIDEHNQESVPSMQKIDNNVKIGSEKVSEVTKKLEGKVNEDLGIVKEVSVTNMELNETQDNLEVVAEKKNDENVSVYPDASVLQGVCGKENEKKVNVAIQKPEESVCKKEEDKSCAEEKQNDEEEQRELVTKSVTSKNENKDEEKSLAEENQNIKEEQIDSATDAINDEEERESVTPKKQNIEQGSNISEQSSNINEGSVEGETVAAKIDNEIDDSYSVVSNLKDPVSGKVENMVLVTHKKKYKKRKGLLLPPRKRRHQVTRGRNPVASKKNRKEIKESVSQNTVENRDSLPLIKCEELEGEQSVISMRGFTKKRRSQKWKFGYIAQNKNFMAMKRDTDHIGSDGTNMFEVGGSELATVSSTSSKNTIPEGLNLVSEKNSTKPNSQSTGVVENIDSLPVIVENSLQIKCEKLEDEKSVTSIKGLSRKRRSQKLKFGHITPLACNKNLTLKADTISDEFDKFEVQRNRDSDKVDIFEGDSDLPTISPVCSENSVDLQKDSDIDSDSIDFDVNFEGFNLVHDNIEGTGNSHEAEIEKSTTKDILLDNVDVKTDISQESDLETSSIDSILVDTGNIKMTADIPDINTEKQSHSVDSVIKNDGEITDNSSGSEKLSPKIKDISCNSEQLPHNHSKKPSNQTEKQSHGFDSVIKNDSEITDISCDSEQLATTHSQNSNNQTEKQSHALNSVVKNGSKNPLIKPAVPVIVKKDHPYAAAVLDKIKIQEILRNHGCLSTAGVAEEAVAAGEACTNPNCQSEAAGETYTSPNECIIVCEEVTEESSYSCTIKLDHVESSPRKQNNTVIDADKSASGNSYGDVCKESSPLKSDLNSEICPNSRRLSSTNNSSNKISVVDNKGDSGITYGDSCKESNTIKPDMNSEISPESHRLSSTDDSSNRISVVDDKNKGDICKKPNTLKSDMKIEISPESHTSSNINDSSNKIDPTEETDRGENYVKAECHKIKDLSSDLSEMSSDDCDGEFLGWEKPKPVVEGNIALIDDSDVTVSDLDEDSTVIIELVKPTTDVHTRVEANNNYICSSVEEASCEDLLNSCDANVSGATVPVTTAEEKLVMCPDVPVSPNQELKGSNLVDKIIPQVNEKDLICAELSEPVSCSIEKLTPATENISRNQEFSGSSLVDKILPHVTEKESLCSEFSESVSCGIEKLTPATENTSPNQQFSRSSPVDKMLPHVNEKKSLCSEFSEPVNSDMEELKDCESRSCLENLELEDSALDCIKRPVLISEDAQRSGSPISEKRKNPPRKRELVNLGFCSPGRFTQAFFQVSRTSSPCFGNSSGLEFSAGCSLSELDGLSLRAEKRRLGPRKSELELLEFKCPGNRNKSIRGDLAEREQFHSFETYITAYYPELKDQYDEIQDEIQEGFDLKLKDTSPEVGDNTDTIEEITDKIEGNTDTIESFSPELEKNTDTMISSCPELEENTDTIESFSPELRENTDTELIENTDSEVKDIIEPEIKESTNSEMQDSSDSEMEEGTDSVVKESTDSAVKESSDIIEKESTNSEMQDSSDSEMKEGTDSVVKESTNSDVKESTDSVIEESTNSAVKENTDSAIKENIDLTVKESTDIAIKESTNTDIAMEESTDSVKESTSSILEESSGLVKESTDSVKESTDLVKESADSVKESTDPVKESTDIAVKESISPVKESTDLLKESPDFVKESTDPVKESTDVAMKESTSPVKESTDLVKESTDIAMKECTDSAVIESTDSVKESMDPVKESTDSVKEDTDLVKESTDPVKESTDPVKESTDPAVKESTDIAEKESSDIAEKESSDIAVKESTDIAEKESSDNTEKESSDIAEKESSDIAEKESSDIAEKESSDIAVKESSDIAEKESNDNTEKESSDIAEKESSGNAEKESSDNAEKESSDIAVIESSDNAEKESSDIAEKESNDNTEKESSDIAEKESSGNAVKESTDIAVKESSDNTEKESSDIAEKESSDNTEKESSDIAEKESSDNAEKESSDIAVIESTSRESEESTGSEVQESQSASHTNSGVKPQLPNKDLYSDDAKYIIREAWEEILYFSPRPLNTPLLPSQRVNTRKSLLTKNKDQGLDMTASSYPWVLKQGLDDDEIDYMRYLDPNFSKYSSAVTNHKSDMYMRIASDDIILKDALSRVKAVMTCCNFNKGLCLVSGTQGNKCFCNINKIISKKRKSNLCCGNITRNNPDLSDEINNEELNNSEMNNSTIDNNNEGYNYPTNRTAFFSSLGLMEKKEYDKEVLAQSLIFHRTRKVCAAKVKASGYNKVQSDSTDKIDTDTDKPRKRPRLLHNARKPQKSRLLSNRKLQNKSRLLGNRKLQDKLLLCNDQKSPHKRPRLLDNDQKPQNKARLLCDNRKPRKPRLLPIDWKPQNNPAFPEVDENPQNNPAFPKVQDKPQNNPAFLEVQDKPQNSAGFPEVNEKHQNNTGFSEVEKKPQNSTGFSEVGEKPQTSTGFSAVGEKPQTSAGFTEANERPHNSTSFPEVDTKPQKQQRLTILCKKVTGIHKVATINDFEGFEEVGVKNNILLKKFRARNKNIEKYKSLTNLHNTKNKILNRIRKNNYRSSIVLNNNCYSAKLIRNINPVKKLVMPESTNMCSDCHEYSLGVKNIIKNPNNLTISWKCPYNCMAKTLPSTNKTSEMVGQKYSNNLKDCSVNNSGTTLEMAGSSTTKKYSDILKNCSVSISPLDGKPQRKRGRPPKRTLFETDQHSVPVGDPASLPNIPDSDNPQKDSVSPLRKKRGRKPKRTLFATDQDYGLVLAPASLPNVPELDNPQKDSLGTGISPVDYEPQRKKLGRKPKRTISATDQDSGQVLASASLPNVSELNNPQNYSVSISSVDYEPQKKKCGRPPKHSSLFAADQYPVPVGAPAAERLLNVPGSVSVSPVDNKPQRKKRSRKPKHTIFATNQYSGPVGASTSLSNVPDSDNPQKDSMSPLRKKRGRKPKHTIFAIDQHTGPDGAPTSLPNISDSVSISSVDNKPIRKKRIRKPKRSIFATDQHSGPVVAPASLSNVPYSDNSQPATVVEEDVTGSELSRNISQIKQSVENIQVETTYKNIASCDKYMSSNNLGGSQTQVPTTSKIQPLSSSQINKDVSSIQVSKCDQLTSDTQNITILTQSSRITEYFARSPKIKSSSTLSPNITKSSVLSPKTTPVSSPSSKITTHSVPSPRTTPKSKITQYFASLPRIKKSSGPSPKVTKSSAPSPEIIKSLGWSPKITKSSTPSPKITKEITPKITKSSGWSPNITKSSAPSPEITKSSTPSPKITKEITPKIIKSSVGSPKTYSPFMSARKIGPQKKLFTPPDKQSESQNTKTTHYVLSNPSDLKMRISTVLSDKKKHISTVLSEGSQPSTSQVTVAKYRNSQLSTGISHLYSVEEETKRQTHPQSSLKTEIKHGNSPLKSKLKSAPVSLKSELKSAPVSPLKSELKSAPVSPLKSEIKSAPVSPLKSDLKLGKSPLKKYEVKSAPVSPLETKKPTHSVTSLKLGHSVSSHKTGLKLGHSVSLKTEQKPGHSVSLKTEQKPGHSVNPVSSHNFHVFRLDKQQISGENLDVYSMENEQNSKDLIGLQNKCKYAPLVSKKRPVSDDNDFLGFESRSDSVKISKSNKKIRYTETRISNTEYNENADTVKISKPNKKSKYAETRISNTEYNENADTVKISKPKKIKYTKTKISNTKFDESIGSLSSVEEKLGLSIEDAYEKLPVPSVSNEKFGLSKIEKFPVSLSSSDYIKDPVTLLDIAIEQRKLSKSSIKLDERKLPVPNIENKLSKSKSSIKLNRAKLPVSSIAINEDKLSKSSIKLSKNKLPVPSTAFNEDKFIKSSIKLSKNKLPVPSIALQDKLSKSSIKLSKDKLIKSPVPNIAINEDKFSKSSLKLSGDKSVNPSLINSTPHSCLFSQKTPLYNFDSSLEDIDEPEDHMKFKSTDIAKLEDNMTNSVDPNTDKECSDDPSIYMGRIMPQIEQDNTANSESHGYRNVANSESPSYRNHSNSESLESYRNLTNSESPGYRNPTNSELIDSYGNPVYDSDFLTNNISGECSSVLGNEEICPSVLGNGRRWHACRFCSQKFSSSGELVKHLRSHTKSRPLKCTMSSCRFTFKYKAALDKHLESHDGKKPHICVCCGASFTQKVHLQSHVRIHSGEKPFVCEICGKSFARPSYLRIHIKTHSESRPYKCETCPQAFKCYANLKRHVRIHMKDKRYQCKYCSATFFVAHTLKLHIRSHTGEKPFQCSHCNTNFRYESSLRRHCIVKHPDSKLAGDLVKETVNSSSKLAVDLTKETVNSGVTEITE